MGVVGTLEEKSAFSIRRGGKLWPSSAIRFTTVGMPNEDLVADDFPEPEFIAGAAPTSSECTLAMLAHLGGLVFSFIPAAILMITQQDKSHFVVRHAREAVNFNVSLFFHSLVIFIPAAAVGATLYFTGMRAPIALLFGSLVALVLSIPLVIFEVLYIVRACMAAGKGQEFRYPLTIRLI